MKRILNPWTQREGYDCSGCCPTNPFGVHMTFFEDGDDIVSLWQPRQHYQGWINTMHGGILSTLIDETAGWVVFRKLQTSGMTTHLDVRYRKAVSTLEKQLTIRGHISEQKRNIVFVDVTIENSAGQNLRGGSGHLFLHASRQSSRDGLRALRSGGVKRKN